jgi:hypothetical protein
MAQSRPRYNSRNDQDFNSQTRRRGAHKSFKDALVTYLILVVIEVQVVWQGVALAFWADGKRKMELAGADQRLPEIGRPDSKLRVLRTVCVIANAIRFNRRPIVRVSEQSPLCHGCF